VYGEWNYAAYRAHLGRISIRICPISGKKGPEMKAFLLITGLFLCAAYFAGIIPGGIQ
jgi:hypothetical protein